MNLYAIKLKKNGYTSDIFNSENIKNLKKINISEILKNQRASLETYGYCNIFNNKYNYAINIEHTIRSEKYNLIFDCIKPLLRNIALNKLL